MNGREWIERMEAAFEDRPEWKSAEEREHLAEGDDGPPHGPEAGYPEAFADNCGNLTIRGRHETHPYPETPVQEIDMTIEDAISLARWILATFPDKAEPEGTQPNTTAEEDGKDG